MINPRFTPREAVYSRLKARGLSFKDIRVGAKVLLTWTENWGEELADELGATPAPRTMFSNTFWLRTTDNNQGGITVAFAPIGAPGTIMLMEDLIACGAESFVGVGASGSLDAKHTVGTVLIPETVKVIDEGTSKHYPGQQPPSGDTALHNKLCYLIEKNGGKTASGDWWSTDGFYREMTDDIASHTEAGIIGVDMETSAMYHLANYRNVKVCNTLIVSDELWADWNYGINFDEFRNGVSIMHKSVIEWAKS
ncbi:MAG: hypothetical protein FI719_07980 [SAR202 cluster bacterium]|nr:hypothetical protein [SAR202 cluster bacterium]